MAFLELFKEVLGHIVTYMFSIRYNRFIDRSHRLWLRQSLWLSNPLFIVHTNQGHIAIKVNLLLHRIIPWFSCFFNDYIKFWSL